LQTRKKRRNLFCVSAVPSLAKTEDKMASVVAKGTAEIREQSCWFGGVAVASKPIYFIHSLSILQKVYI